MNSRHRKTLEQVFAVPKAMVWADIEALLMVAGAERVKRGGSMVSFFLNDERGDFHRPHPAKEAKPYQVRDARRLLELAGVTP